MAHGADASACNFAGRSPAAKAAANGHGSVAAWLDRVAAGQQQPPLPAELAAELAGAAGRHNSQPRSKLDERAVPSGGNSGSVKGDRSSGGDGTAQAGAVLTPTERQQVDALLRRPWDGLGSPGAPAKPGLAWYRLSAVTLVIFW